MSEELKKSEESETEFATRDEIVALANDMSKLQSLMERVVSSVQKQAPLEQKEVKPVEVDPTPDDVPVPPSFRQAVDEILGKDFGAKVVYDPNGSGFLFSVIVPLDKSNADKTYLSVHKVDMRSRSLTGGEGLAGVRDWCTRVRKNLERSGVRFPVL